MANIKPIKIVKNSDPAHADSPSTIYIQGEDLKLLKILPLYNNDHEQ